MAAYDNVQLPGPPDIAKAGQFGAQLFQMLSQLPQDYWKGQDAQYQQRQRNLFQGGVPTDASGNPNYGQMLTKMIQSGGAPVAGQMLGPMLDLQNQSAFYRALQNYRGGNDGGANTGPATSTSASGPANITGATQPQPQISSAGMDNAGAETLRSLTAGIAGGRAMPDQFISRFANQLGVDPDAPLSAAQEARVRQVLGGSTPGVSAPNRGGTRPVTGTGYEQDENNTNQGTPVGSMGGGGPISPAPTSASGNIGGAPRQPLRMTVTPGTQGAPFDQRFNAAYGGGQGGAGGIPTPIGTMADADKLDAQAEKLFTLSAAPRISPQQAAAAKATGEQLAAKARQIREQLGQYNSPANNPSMQGMKGLFEGASKAKGERIGEIVKAGPPARQMVNQLDIMEDAIRSARGNISTGPGAETFLKVKQTLSNLGVDMKGLSQSEVIVKMNAYLASEAAKQMTNRPSQMEFKAFMASNPGLSTSLNGTLHLIDILRQSANQTIGLGRLGMNEKNWANWGDVEQNYFEQHPIRMPFSGNPAGGQTQGRPAGAPAPGRYQWTPEGGLRPMQ